MKKKKKKKKMELAFSPETPITTRHATVALSQKLTSAAHFTNNSCFSPNIPGNEIKEH
jgi:hypothetical protein